MRPALLLLPLLLALAAWTPGASAMTRPDIVKALLEAKAGEGGVERGRGRA